MENWPGILPAFVRVDCETDEVTPIDPPRSPRIVKKPEEFGDSWSDQLTAEDKGRIRPVRHYEKILGSSRFPQEGRALPSISIARSATSGSASNARATR